MRNYKVMIPVDFVKAKPISGHYELTVTKEQLREMDLKEALQGDFVIDDWEVEEIGKPILYWTNIVQI